MDGNGPVSNERLSRSTRSRAKSRSELQPTATKRSRPDGFPIPAQHRKVYVTRTRKNRNPGRDRIGNRHLECVLAHAYSRSEAAGREARDRQLFTKQRIA